MFKIDQDQPVKAEDHPPSNQQNEDQEISQEDMDSNKLAANEDIFNYKPTTKPFFVANFPQLSLTQMFRKSDSDPNEPFIIPLTKNNKYIEIKEQSSLIKQDHQWEEEPRVKNFRSSIGLKFLSKKVRDIIKKKKFTNYQLMSFDLIDALKSEFERSPKKEEVNIKRRVYDALNVMISSGFLHQQGKFFVLTIRTPTDILQQIQLLRNGIEEIQERRILKKEKIQENVIRFLAIQNLIQRNKQFRLGKPNFKFPILVINGKMKYGEIEIKTDERKKVVAFYAKEAIELRSDIEILTMLGMQKLNPQNVLKMIGYELFSMLDSKQKQQLWS